jgi:hypothetical protein
MLKKKIHVNRSIHVQIKKFDFFVFLDVEKENVSIQRIVLFMEINMNNVNNNAQEYQIINIYSYL